jgi:hypothetical protein
MNGAELPRKIAIAIGIVFVTAAPIFLLGRRPLRLRHAICWTTLIAMVEDFLQGWDGTSLPWLTRLS